MPKTKPKTIDEILAGANAEQRTALQKLRRTIHAAAPGAEECISYGLAAFRLDGRPLVAFSAWKNHCAFYPMSSTTVGMFRKELKDFETSKGTIRFNTDQPLPAALAKKLVKARIAENAEKGGQRGASKRARMKHTRRSYIANRRPGRGAASEEDIWHTHGGSEHRSEGTCFNPPAEQCSALHQGLAVLRGLRAAS